MEIEEGEETAGRAGPAPGIGLWGPVAALATVTLILGMSPGPLLAFAERAAEMLLDPAPYITAVLGVVR